MKILVIGSGGREHTLCWKIAQSPKVEKIYCIPGNAGIAEHWETAPVNADNIDNVLSYARAAGIDLTVVGPEAPLVDGIVDRFQEAGLKIFGPNSAAALLEGDKAFAKEIMAENDIPTAEFRVCTDYYSALEAVMERGFPIVIKVAGLAAGKGVFIVKSASEVEQILTAIFKEKKFGHEGNAVVVEKCLHGEEISVFAVVAARAYGCCGDRLQRTGKRLRVLGWPALHGGDLDPHGCGARQHLSPWFGPRLLAGVRYLRLGVFLAGFWTNAR